MRHFLFVLAALIATPALAQNSGSGSQPDAAANVTLDLTQVCAAGTATASCPAGSVYEMPIGNGQGVVAVDITGLSGSGATVVVERTVGLVYSSRNLLVSGSGGAFAASVTADGSFTLNSVGSRAIRFRVSTAGAGTARIAANAVANSSIVQFATSLPTGNLTIGSIGNTSFGVSGLLPGFASPPTVNVGTMPNVTINGPLAVTQSGSWAETVSGTVGLASGTSVAVSNLPATQPVSGTVAATQSGTWNVGVTNFPASQAVTGTFWQATQPISAAALPLPTGASTAALQSQISAQLPATLGPKTAATSLSITSSSDTPVSTAETPSTLTTIGLAPVTAANATALLVKNAPGNLYTAEITAGTVAGYLVVANLTAIPASGATIPFIRCIAAPANLTASSGSGIPFRATTGIVILFSTSCTTYTPVSTAAVSILGRAM